MAASTDILIYGYFYVGKVGKTGLTDVKVDVIRITRSSGAKTQTVTAGVCVEGLRGSYFYRLAAVDMGTYDYQGVFYTADATVDKQETPAVFPNFLAGLKMNAAGQVDLGLWLGSAPSALYGGAVPADLKTWLGSSPYGLSSGYVPADVKLWLAAAPAALVSSYVQTQVSSYSSGMNPSAQILQTANQKIYTDIYGNVGVSGNVTVGGYATGMSPSAQLLTNTTYKILTDASGNVSVAGGTGGGTSPWSAADVEQARFVLGLDGTATQPTLTRGRIQDIKAQTDKLVFNGTNVICHVASYAAGQTAADSVLATPTNKLYTDASGNVSAVGGTGGTGGGVSPWSTADVEQARFMLGLDGTATQPTISRGHLLAIKTQTDKLTFNGTNVICQVSSYATGQSPADLILLTPANKLMTDASGNVSTASAGGTGVADWLESEKQVFRTVLGITGAGLAPLGTGIIPQIKAKLDSIVLDANGNVNSNVNSYAVNLSPKEQILSSPSYKISTTSTGMVTVADSATVISINQKTSQMQFVGGFLRANVDAYTTGFAPKDQVLLTPANRIATNTGGQVATQPVILDSSGFSNLIVDGFPFMDVMKAVAAMAAGEVTFNAQTGIGEVSMIGNPNIMRIRFTADPSFLTRTNVIMAFA